MAHFTVHSYGILLLANPVLAALVYVDAKRLGMIYGEPSGAAPRLGAAGWALGTLLVPLIYVPAYAIRRHRIRTPGLPTTPGQD